MNTSQRHLSGIVLASFISLALFATDSRASDGSLEVFVDDVYVAGGVLVDDFSGTTVDFSKWTTGNEFTAKLDTDNDNLVMISAGSSHSLAFNNTRTFLVSPGPMLGSAGGVTMNCPGWAPPTVMSVMKSGASPPPDV